MPWMAILPAVASLGSAAVGAVSSASDRAAQQAEIQNAIAQYEKIGVPSDKALELTLQHYKSAGRLTPEMEQLFLQQKSKLSDIAPSQEDRIAQERALQTLQNLGENGGMLLSDKAQLNNTLNQVNASNRGRQQAILQNAAARGTLNGGAALAMQMQAAQNAAQNSQQAGLDINAQAQQRALAAITGAGELGGQMEQRNWNEKAAQAQAADAINRFNTMNRQSVSNDNTQLNNYAQQWNLSNQQDVMNKNTGVDNYQREYNAKIPQQIFQDQIAKAAGETGQMGNMANYYGNQAQQTANTWGNIAEGIGKAGAAYGQYKSFQDYLKSIKPQQSDSLSSQISNYQLPAFPGEEEQP